MKVMISQPMNGKNEFEIKATKEEAVKFLEENGYEVVNTLFDDVWIHRENMDGVTKIPLYFLAKSLESMSKCDAVYFCKGWEYARGCKIEHEAAVEYGLKIIYE